MTDWRLLMEFLRSRTQHRTRYETVTIQNEEQLTKYLPEFPNARLGTTLRIALPAKFEPSR